ncbi:uncharacterized protein EI97DRAFT_5594 [Westerdykella ornata]|uniref:Uncharacterized protein n=1 Tax=Westerdykella ornata TaxID=318751 RepID=A0A6A6JWV7_WESOR|nr:uncharacterized protein EI97DRAFT_5594 [Westerdykella ornata]KAF2280684.1 hypothetical protein EI97DRAFT_5594 [Westerdykella ornata]
MAASTDSKPALSTLKTPLSATYPSELRSPMVHSASTPTFIKREESLKTPITPPSAYLDFLKTLSPAIMSPLPSSASTRFVFEGNRPTSIPSASSSSTSASSSSFTSTSGPADKTTSRASSRSSSCCNCDKEKSCQQKDSQHQHQHCHQQPPQQKQQQLQQQQQPEPPMSAPPTKLHTVTIPPPSPFTRPQSARTPRLYIPQSPYSPSTVRSPGVRSPGSAHSITSPYSAASPKPWDLEGKKTGRTRRVSVREVVTRTVTYSHSATSTPIEGRFAPPQIDPAPRGKRRRVE